MMMIMRAEVQNDFEEAEFVLEYRQQEEGVLHPVLARPMVCWRLERR
jgi:hypothetical protein